MHATEEGALRRVLEPFGAPEEGVEDPGGHTVFPIDPYELPVPELVLFLLTEAMGLPNRGRGEKTEWAVPFRFRGRPMSLASQKFGLRLYVAGGGDEGGEGPRRLADDVVRRLEKALRIVERERLSGHVHEQVDQGRLTIANQAGPLRAMYEHFRDSAAESFAAAEDSSAEPGDESAGNFVAVGRHLENRQIGEWHALAAINAYFSLLEHEMVLISAFSHLDPTGGALEQFIGDRWAGKFRGLFDLEDGEAKRVYDDLLEIAEGYRNPYSHGGFDKRRAALWIHLDGIGAVPARLSEVRSSPHFELFPIRSEGFVALCARLDAADRWLRGGRYAAAFEWVDAGLDVAFDPESRAAHRAFADDDPDGRRATLDRLQDARDRAANMDW